MLHPSDEGRSMPDWLRVEAECLSLTAAGLGYRNRMATVKGRLSAEAGSSRHLLAVPSSPMLFLPVEALLRYPLGERAIGLTSGDHPPQVRHDPSPVLLIPHTPELESDARR